MYLAALLVIGFGNLAAAQDYNLFKAYTALNLPRSSVPVGAKWIPGTGPTGPALPVDMLDTSTSLDATTIDASLERNLTFSIAKYLGLNAAQTAKINAKFTNLSIVRVNDLSRVTHVRAGEQILFEAIKAGTIKITTATDLAGTIEANAQTKGIDVVAKAGGEHATSITLDGRNLFVAYQVLSFDSGKASTKTVNHRGGDVIIDKTYRFRFCQCTPGQVIHIEIQDLTAPRLDGTLDTQVIRFDPVSDRLIEYNLKPHFDGDKVTAARVFFRYLATQECTPMGGMTDKNGNPVRLCGEIKYPKGQNSITLTRTAFKIHPVSNPGGNY